MLAAETQAVAGAFPPGAVRFVGGCVRDTVLGRPIGDIDLATPLRPDDVTTRLEAAGIKVVPTGLKHGTVTAVSGGRPFEITTLRVDVSTDGRRAVVAFTDDWDRDAARRDFTMNALSLEPDGRLHDPFGGEADALAGRVRFVGDADQRIVEDYLRLLRYFRFLAHYGRNGADGAQPDAGALAACRRHAPQLDRLSGERIGTEVLRLLAAPDPTAVVRLMAQEEIWTHAVPARAPGASAVERLRALVTVEGVGTGADPLRRLAVLVPPGAASAVADRLRLSRADAARLEALVREVEPIDPDLSEVALLRRLHAEGGPLVRDRAILAWAASLAEGRLPDRRSAEDWRALLARAAAWVEPRLPVGGDDARSLGLKGPAIGQALSALREWWIGERHVPDRDACLAKLRAIARP
ncbi:MAG: CCA tRNA nucleotidyltransferase [Alphaproteobacteria bacterium]|nr:CCA tRNA nucleotidyltransferase [Alphaproteobacteria bacterium]